MSSCRFWEVEKCGVDGYLTSEESAVMKHFKDHHTRLTDGRFMVPLPKNLEIKPLGESRAQAVCRFLTFERSVHFKGLFPEVKAVIHEYFDMGTRRVSS